MTRLDFLRASWRPALGWSAVVLNMLYGVTTVGLLIAGRVSLPDAMALIMTQLGFATVPTSLYVTGRTAEKRDAMAAGPAPGEGAQE